MADGDAFNGENLVQILLAEAADKLGEKVRPVAEAAAGYAEDGPTFDPSGDYLCGTCALRLEPNACAFVQGRISMELGGCIVYYRGEQIYKVAREHQFDQKDVLYTERPKEKGFGCKRCEYSETAEVKDSAGRESFCNFWQMHVKPDACCYRNEGEDDVMAPGEKREDVDAGAEELAREMLDTLEAEALFSGVRIEGFTRPEEEAIRATMSRVPPELMNNVAKIVSDRGMTPKHGNYDKETKTIKINPEIIGLRQRFGRGQGWMSHVETTMVHEFGHSVFESLDEERQNDWNALSGWSRSGDDGSGEYSDRYVERRPGWPAYTSEWRHKKGVRFTRHYAEKNPDEDFADSFSFFILGKPAQMARSKREYLRKLIASRVHRYPQALIEGPSKAYAERGN